KDKVSKDDALIGEIALQDLVQYVTLKPGADLSLLTSPTFASCKAELEAKRRIEQIQWSADSRSAAGDPGGRGDADADDVVAAPENADDDKLASTAKLVRDEVNLLMETATSPESKLLFSVPKRSDEGALEKSIVTFELRDGPSDVTSYHDFSTLQIA